MVLCFCIPAPALATEISIPDVTTKSGQKITVPVMIDQVNWLAGVKLMLTFSPEVLQYQGGYDRCQERA